MHAVQCNIVFCNFFFSFGELIDDNSAQFGGSFADPFGWFQVSGSGRLIRKTNENSKSERQKTLLKRHADYTELMSIGEELH